MRLSKEPLFSLEPHQEKRFYKNNKKLTKLINSINMALGNIAETDKKKTYLSINHGKIVQGSGANKQLYSYLDGFLETIYKKRSRFGNEVVTRWFIDIRDGADLYSLCLHYSSGVFKSIILALASDEALTSFTPLRIEPYEGKNGYTKVVVYSDGVKLDWVTKQLPEQKTVVVGGKTIRDDSKQMELIESYVNQIVERITRNK